MNNEADNQLQHIFSNVNDWLKFAEAKKAYDKAVAIDPKNNFIRQNFDQFMEIYERQNRRRNR